MIHEYVRDHLFRLYWLMSIFVSVMWLVQSLFARHNSQSVSQSLQVYSIQCIGVIPLYIMYGYYPYSRTHLFLNCCAFKYRSITQPHSANSVAKSMEWQINLANRCLMFAQHVMKVQSDKRLTHKVFQPGDQFYCPVMIFPCMGHYPFHCRTVKGASVCIQICAYHPDGYTCYVC